MVDWRRCALKLKPWLIRSSLVLCTAGALSSVQSSAWAQGSAGSDELKLAREQFNQALALQTGGDWAGALSLLKQVAAVKPTPQVRFNIALCEERVGRLVAALGDYELAADDARTDRNEQVVAEAGTRLEALKARVPRVVVQRSAGADSATISLDGVVLGDAVLNLPLPADPGPHVVEASASGFRPFKHAFRIAEQQTATIFVKLEAEPVREAPSLAPGKRPSAQTVRAAGFVAGGVGSAGLIASGAIFYLRHTTITDLDAQCGSGRQSCPESSRSTVDRGKSYTTFGDVTLAVGAVGLGAGAALLIAGSRSPAQASVSLAPAAACADAGVTLLGRF
jgi:hypothetical protein